jgi:ankyrin repeat protein
MTPLHYALLSLPRLPQFREDLQKVIRILLESGANDNLPDEHGKTPLQIVQTFFQHDENNPSI